MTDSVSVLVVDDDKLSRVTTAKQLAAGGYSVTDAEGPFPALKLLENQSWDVVLSDLRMPGMDGIQFLQRIKQLHPETEVILMTAYGTVATAVDAMHLGAADYLTKPFRFEELNLRLARIAELHHTKAELKILRDIVGKPKDTFGLIGRSPQMNQVRERIRSFADHAVPVLITGETGTGKEVVSRALHGQSRRKDRKFVAVGCGTIPRDLAESELFGHEKGSFTGATERRIGSFEQANRGTLLLDDIDDLPKDIQVKLLRALQEGYIRRVGGTEEISIDVRVIATTKVELEAEVKADNFRPDLFYRLRGLEIHLPALRERGDDVLVLADAFLHRYAIEISQGVKNLTPDAAQKLRDYSWPGNVRELRRAIESSCVLAANDQISIDSLPEFLTRKNNGSSSFTLQLDHCDSVNLPTLVHDFEVAVMQWALSRCSGGQSQAARMLGVPRTTLQSKLGHS
jgi:DNA-binding NtrC family response regulator